MQNGASIFDNIAAGWRFVVRHRGDLVRSGLLAAILWIALRCAADAGMAVTRTLADMVLVVFAIDWFRLVLSRMGMNTTRPDGARAGVGHIQRSVSRVCRVAGRSAVVVMLATLVLLPPTLVLAAGRLVLDGGALTEQALSNAVAVALPFAMLMVSPVLVRFYLYYAVVLSGRRGVRVRDIWRWSRGRSVRLLMLLALSIAPGVVAIAGADVLDGGLAVAGFVLAAPVMFFSVAVMMTVTAYGMAGLIVPPVISATRPH